MSKAGNWQGQEHKVQFAQGSNDGHTTKHTVAHGDGLLVCCCLQEGDRPQSSFTALAGTADGMPKIPGSGSSTAAESPSQRADGVAFKN